jgi:hypothetical protein
MATRRYSPRQGPTRQAFTAGDRRTMFIDSHCHINFPELSERLPAILEKMKENQV